MPQISVVIITFNEEKNIERCLLSVKDVADDIVVVDSFSTDRTEEICEKHGARFIKHVFEGHIEQKNWAITQAKYPHVLSLDADEALSKELIHSILEVKSDWKYDGYYFNRLNNYCGKWIKHTIWYPDRKMRLLDSRKGSWKGVNPHDKYEMKVRTSVKHLKGNLLHYSFNSISEHINQVNKFSDIAAMAYYERGYKANFLKIIINPIWMFFRSYFFRLGFLDGHYGLKVSVTAAYGTYLKYLKLREITLKKISELS